MLISLMIFYLFKQKTAYEMRISDWSSDVCSSDLPELTALVRVPRHAHLAHLREELDALARVQAEAAAEAAGYERLGGQGAGRAAARDPGERLGELLSLLEIHLQRIGRGAQAFLQRVEADVHVAQGTLQRVVADELLLRVSDLAGGAADELGNSERRDAADQPSQPGKQAAAHAGRDGAAGDVARRPHGIPEIGRASWRERVCQYV